MVKKALIPILLSMTLSCAPLVVVPPEIDLMPLEQIGLITFEVENAEGALHEIATQRFIEEIQEGQQGIRIVELGTMRDVLAKSRGNAIDPQTAADIGEAFGVSAFFLGKITVSDVRPKFDISAVVKSLRIQATFDMSMSARLIDVDGGATLWTHSVDRSSNLAFLHLSEGMVPHFDVKDQSKAYRELISQMVWSLTRDFRPSRRRMR